MRRPLANIIKKAVRAAKVSPAIIAKSATVSVPTLYSMMSGRTPSQRNLEKVCNVLNIHWMSVVQAWQDQRAQDKRMRYGAEVKEQDNKLPKDVQLLIKRYASLPKAAKRTVMSVIGMIANGYRPTR